MIRPIESFQELGDRVAEARKAAGKSQAELGDEIGLDRTAISKIESGARRVDSLELARLSTVLRRSIEWFVSQPLPAVVSRRASRDSAVQSASDILLEEVARDVELLVELGVLDPDLDRRFEPPTPVESVESAESVAMALREHLNLGCDPAWDLQRAVEPAGLFAYCFDLGDDRLDGAYLAVERCGVAVINGGVPSGRRRFTLAHELGHHVLADQCSVEWMTSLGGEREKLINAFAIHFLMPRDGVARRWEELGGSTDARKAALSIGVEFGVSWTAACAHLRNLGLLEAAHGSIESDRPIKVEYLERGLTVREDLVPPAIPAQVAAAALRAYRSHKLSAARTIEILRGQVDEGELPPDDMVPLDAMRAEVEPIEA